MRGAGRATFAAVMLLLLGVLNVVYGIAALDKANVLVNDTRLILTNLNTMGWVVIVLGVIQLIGGVSLLGGNTFGRIIGVLGGTLGAIGALLAEGNGEAILLVEDKADLLHSTSEALHHLGYVVTPCNTPEEALQLVADGRTRFDLLMTDIVMPKMDGRELAARCLALQPAIKCLYVSGYPAQFISKRGLIDDEVYFLRKPFSLAALAAMVRDVLRS